VLTLKVFIRIFDSPHAWYQILRPCGGTIVNATLFTADAETHLKVIALSLLAATVVVWVSIFAK
jgi:hypothetical protein